MALTREDFLQWLQTEYGVAPPADDTPLFSAGLLDSHAMIDVLSLIESRTGRRVGWKDVTLANMDSVARIVALANRA